MTDEICSAHFNKLVKEVLAGLAPAALPAVTFTRGSQAVEKAIMTAMKEREMTNSVAVGFTGSSHGSPASFAMSGFRGAIKLPSLQWPTVAYPKNVAEES